MTRFAIATVLAAVLGLATASTADAQYIIQYGRVTPNGGVVTTSQLYNLGTYQSYNTYTSPFGVVQGRSAYYTDIYGNSFGRAAGYNNWNGNFYNRGFYQPNPYINPFGGYSYNFYRRW